MAPAQLLVTNLAHLPVQGRQARQSVPFGDSVLTVVVAPRVPLSGTLPQHLPWVILVVGILLSLGAAALTARLIQGRLDAEHLAGELEGAVHENQQLYAEQRTIAQTLQQALLPAELPHLAGTETSALYEPGEEGVDIGGDWYDVIPLDDHRLLTVVGDVSGRGLQAATTMASLRYAIHAYAAQSDPPATILTKLSGLLRVTTAGQFATVLCAVLDIRTHEVTVASAGHLPALLLADGHGEYLECVVGPPVGVQTGVRYTAMTVAVPRPRPCSPTPMGSWNGAVRASTTDWLDSALRRWPETATWADCCSSSSMTYVTDIPMTTRLLWGCDGRHSVGGRTPDGLRPGTGAGWHAGRHRTR